VNPKLEARLVLEEEDPVLRYDELYFSWNTEDAAGGFDDRLKELGTVLLQSQKASGQIPSDRVQAGRVSHVGRPSKRCGARIEEPPPGHELGNIPSLKRGIGSGGREAATCRGDFDADAFAGPPPTTAGFYLEKVGGRPVLGGPMQVLIDNEPALGSRQPDTPGELDRVVSKPSSKFDGFCGVAFPRQVKQSTAREHFWFKVMASKGIGQEAQGVEDVALPSCIRADEKIQAVEAELEGPKASKSRSC
jgi:hypothetical protein